MCVCVCVGWADELVGGAQEKEALPLCCFGE